MRSFGEARSSDGAFDYLLREPRHARRWRRTWIAVCIVAFVALAPLAWVIGG
jgi:hypothetical protein